MKCFLISIFTFILSSFAYELKDAKEYYASGNVESMVITWNDQRESISKGIQYAMLENIGKNGLNVFNLKEKVFRLTKSYFQRQGPVGILLQNLNLRQLPYCWEPAADLSLPSNILKIKCVLTKMIINADYIVMRNKSEIIEDVTEQKPFVVSPFLYKQVKNIGQMTLVVEGCVLSGYVITRMKAGKVVLGHENFDLNYCQYQAEIYKRGLGEPPVIVPYSPRNEPYSFEIKHYLLMAIKDEIKTKLQAAVYSYVNLTEIFEGKQNTFEEKEEILFRSTSDSITKYIRQYNKDIIDRNGGDVDLPNYSISWDYWDSSLPNELNEPASIKLTAMVLNGLDTAYNPNTGGPFKLKSPMIGEQLRFSKLQIRGFVSFIPEANSDFGIEISDVAVNTEAGKSNEIVTNVIGYRDISFQLPDFIPGPIQGIITGYVKNVLGRVIVQNMRSVNFGAGAQNSNKAARLPSDYEYTDGEKYNKTRQKRKS